MAKISSRKIASDQITLINAALVDYRNRDHDQLPADARVFARRLVAEIRRLEAIRQAVLVGERQAAGERARR